MKRLLVVALFASNFALAQSKKSIFTTFASGLAYNNQEGIGKSNSFGFATTTGLEYQYSKNIFLFCGFDFQSLGVKKQAINYSVEGNLSIIPLNFGILVKKSQLKFAEYLKLGTGIAIVSTPYAEIKNSNFIEIKSDSRISPILQGGIGFERNYKSNFIPYLELYSLHATAGSNLQNNGLWVFALLVGLKMKM